MHEFSICEALLRQLNDIAAAHGAQRVALIRLRIGVLAGIESSLLKRAFEIARIGTLAAEARLVIVTAPVEISCRTCDATAEVAANRLACPACGAIDVRIIAGEELILDSLELDVPDEPTAPLHDREANCHV